jgi:hypothetical protein
MNHIKSTVKRIALFFIAITFLAQHATAQITNLRFSNEAATYAPISGGTSLVAAGTALGAG